MNQNNYHLNSNHGINLVLETDIHRDENGDSNDDIPPEEDEPNCPIICHTTK